METIASYKSLTVRRAFTLVELMVAVAIVGVLIALLLPAVQAAREAGRRAQCMNNLKQVGLGIQHYHDAHNAFPPGAVALKMRQYYGFNWVYYILPFMEGGAEYETLQKGFHDTEGGSLAINWVLRSKFSHKSVPWLLCPSSPLDAWGVEHGDYGPSFPSTPNPAKFQMLDYSAVSGSYISRHRRERTTNPDERKGLSGLMPPYASGTDHGGESEVNKNATVIGGLLRGKFGVRQREVTDGLSKTMAVAETSGLLIYNDGSTKWGRSEDKNGSLVRGPCCLDYMPLMNRGTMSINHPVGEVSAELVAARDGLPINSGHGPAGMVVMGDGSVHFFHEEMDLVLLYSLADRDDGMVLDSNSIP